MTLVSVPLSPESIGSGTILTSTTAPLSTNLANHSGGTGFVFPSLSGSWTGCVIPAVGTKILTRWLCLFQLSSEAETIGGSGASCAVA